MTGGAGNDTYVVDDTTGTIDVVTEALNGGTDTVSTALTYTLGNNVENLVLTGGAAVNGTGNALANSLTGNTGANTLTGGDGSDTINGGAGTDTAVFSSGVVNYSLNTDGLDNIVVKANVGLEGTDTLASIEQVTFGGVNYGVVRGTGGNDAALNGAAGAAGSQLVLGLAGNDAINGGAGNDLILGGSGDDTITQDGALGGRDIVDGGSENAGPGDRFVINGDNSVEAYRVYSRVAAIGAGINLINADTEIVITRNGTSNASVVAELREIEEITINTGGGADTVTSHWQLQPDQPELQHHHRQRQPRQRHR